MSIPVSGPLQSAWALYPSLLYQEISTTNVSEAGFTIWDAWWFGSTVVPPIPYPPMNIGMMVAQVAQ